MSALGVILRARARATWNRFLGLRDESQLKIAAQATTVDCSDDLPLKVLDYCIDLVATGKLSFCV